MKIERISDPIASAIDSDLVYNHINEDNSVDNALMASYISSAIDEIEAITDIALVSQGWKITLDRFPTNPYKIVTNNQIYSNDFVSIFLPKGSVISIDSFTYLDTSEVGQTLIENTDFTVESVGFETRIVPVESSWPSASVDIKGSVRIEYTVGLGIDATTVAAEAAWTQIAIMLKVQQYWDGCDESQAFKMQTGRHKLFFDYNKNTR